MHRRTFASIRTAGARWIAGAALAACVAAEAGAQARATESPADNPDLPQACGLNVLMILDESGSIGNNDDDVRDAFKGFTAAIKNTSSSMAVAEFSKVARLPQIGNFPRGEYITVTDATKVELDDYVDNEYHPNGNTNWEDGLRMGISGSAFAPRPDLSVPHLTVFITDGDPTQVIRGDRVSSEEYLNKVPLDDDETSSLNDEDDAADRAVANANNLKEQGSHVLVIAVGNGVSSNSSLQRIQRISGPDVFDGNGTFDITTDDVYRATNFSELETALRDAAFQLCSPSVTVEKLIDLTPDPNSLDDALPGSGWQITGSVTAPGSGDFAWVLPMAEDPGTNPKSALTDATGFATFQWRPESEVAPSQFSVSETMQSGFSNDSTQTACTFRTPDSPDQPLALTAVGDGSFAAEIPVQSIVTCRFVNLAAPAPAIELEKFTDGADADTAPGPAIPRGDAVNWTYVVTNTGNMRLDNVTLSDEVTAPLSGAGLAESIDCARPMPFSLAQGDSITCTATGTSGRLPDNATFNGQYANLAEVSAVDSAGTPVSDSDPSHYSVVVPGIHVEKFTNGRNADRRPGPFVAVGAAINWRYEVSNTGADPLADVSVDDDDPGVTPVYDSGDLNGNDLLDPGETWVYRAAGTAIAGQYTNRARATGQATAETVTDEDPSHYFGGAPGIAIEKSTNGSDADTAPGPEIPAGEQVVWIYRVTNTGNIPLANWSVTDDRESGVVCPGVILRPGDSAVCHASGTAQAGQYANVATVTVSDPLGGPDLTASDPSHYFGAVPALTLEKRTNGVDADAPAGPFIPVGDVVNWSYAVTNRGNATLDLISVVDSKLPLGSVNCGQTQLDPNETITCTASDTAAAGQYRNIGLALARLANAGPAARGPLVGAHDPSHYFGASPGIDIEKFTNGLDADTVADAVEIPVGKLVEWGYLVTNSGNEPLHSVQVADDQGVAPVFADGDSNSNGELDPGESWLFEARGVAVAGPYSNIGTVTAQDLLGASVSDDDPSNYLGIFSAVTLEKSTNGEDADLPPGPNIAVGSTVTWEYRVSNAGTSVLNNPQLVDDQGVIPVLTGGDDGNGTLDPGETWVYTATGSAIAGQYANIATFEAVSTSGGVTEEVSASDPSHYFGGASSPAITIEKYTNGRDADTAPGPLLAVGARAIFAYVVQNTGDVPLTDVLVTDDRGVAVTCVGGNPIPLIGVGQRGLCAGETTVVSGQYRNVGEASGVGSFGTRASASDPSHHYGYVPPAGPPSPAITLEKSTNGVDADEPPGPQLKVGSAVSFSYVVSNTGNVPLSDAAVSDDQGVVVDCPSGNPVPLLLPGASETCSGSAEAVEGQYQNIGAVSAGAPGRATVGDDDPSHYLGVLHLTDIPAVPALGLAILALLLAGAAYRRR